MQPENSLIKAGRGHDGRIPLRVEVTEHTKTTSDCALILNMEVKQGESLTQKAEWPKENLRVDKNLMAHAGMHLLYLMWYTYMAPVESLGDQQ